MTREPFLLESQKGRRFALLTRPSGPCHGVLLHLHAFAEEMNKSRRMVALAALAFARRGWAVFQLDHYGCGDSCGDFGDATWQDWIDDVALARDWLRDNVPYPPALWTLRSGSLTAAAWLSQTAEQVPLLLWQPVSNGKQHITQFLRLKAAAAMQGDGEDRTVMVDLRRSIEAGNEVEVAGYMLSPELVRGLESATLVLPEAYVAPVALIEVVSVARLEPSPSIARLAEDWRSSGVPAAASVVAGASFWQTQEIETVPELIKSSVDLLEDWT